MGMPPRAITPSPLARPPSRGADEVGRRERLACNVTRRAPSLSAVIRHGLSPIRAGRRRPAELALSRRRGDPLALSDSRRVQQHLRRPPVDIAVADEIAHEPQPLPLLAG